MKLLLELKIENMFKSKDFKDKDTGEVKVGKWKIQTFDNIQNDDGSEQLKLYDVSIPDGSVEELKSKIGKVVTIPVGTYVNGGRVGYYGI